MGNQFDLKSYEVDAVLKFFMYYLDMEQRGRLMREYPAIYEKLTGVKMSVTSTSSSPKEAMRCQEEK